MGVANYAWGVELKPVGTTGPISLRISDAAVEIPGAQYDPGIESWSAFPLGAAGLLSNQYFVPRFTLTLLARNYSPQEPDQDLITLFQTHDFLQAEVLLYQQDFGLSSGEQTVFAGVVDTVQSLTDETVVLSVTAEDSTSVRPAFQLTRALYPEMRGIDEGKVPPVVIGEAAWTASALLQDMGSTVAGLSASLDWRRFVPTRGLGPGYVIDTDDPSGYLVRAASVNGGAQDLNSSGPVNGLLWPDDPRSPLELTNTSHSNGVVTIAKELAANYPNSVSSISLAPPGGPQDGQIRVRRFHSPHDVVDATNNAWTNPQFALDRTDLSTYAEAGKGTSTPSANWAEWFQSEGRFMRYPSRPNLVIRQTDGGNPAVVALVYGVSNTGNNLTWQIRVFIRGQSLVLVTRDLTAQAGGWAIIFWEMQDEWCSGIAGVDDLIFFRGTSVANRQWYGENFDVTDQLYDHIAVRAVNAQTEAAQKPRIAQIGISFEHLVDPGPLTVLTKGGYLRGIEKEGDQARPASVLCNFTNAGPPYTPSTVITNALIQYTVSAKKPIQAGDIAGTGVGSFFALNALLSSNVSTVTGGAVTAFNLAGVEERDQPFRDTLTTLMRSMFCDIWYSPRRQLYGIKAFQAGQATDGATLYADDMWGPPQREALSLGDVYNAIYLTCWNGRRTVSIDSTDFRSRKWDGTRDLDREVEANASQPRWGRRVLNVELAYIRDPSTANEVLVRMWNMLREPRPTYRFPVSPEWALAREQSEVFTTSAELDALVPIAVKGKTSWGGVTWQITSIQIEPRAGAIVTARWNDPFP